MRGEFELIDLLRERIAAAGAATGGRVLVGSGDDAAVTVPGGVTATTVDAVVDGVHFRRSRSRRGDRRQGARRGAVGPGRDGCRTG